LVLFFYELRLRCHIIKKLQIRLNIVLGIQKNDFFDEHCKTQKGNLAQIDYICFKKTGFLIVLLQKFMRFCLILTLLLFTICCKNHENKFELEGTWKDMSCQNNLNNCESRYPIIVIGSVVSDSLIVMNHKENWETIPTTSKWQSFSLELENNYESLLFPNYETNTLQYYDDVKKGFVYYKKTSKK